MPRSVLVLCDDPDLFASVRTTLKDDNRFIDSGDELHCDGSTAPLTNIYPVENQSGDWEAWDPASTGVAGPEAMSTLVFECRSPDWVAEVGLLIAAGSDRAVWFVDSAGVAWPAAYVDPKRVALA